MGAKDPENAAARPAGAPPSASCTLLAGGDVALNRPQARGAFGRLNRLFQAADLAFTNLELPLSRGGRPAPGKILLRGAPEMIEALAEARFDVLSFANNHALDYGEEAFFETLSLLEARALPAVGAGADLVAARKGAILERGGLRVGVLAFSSVLPRGFAAGPGAPGVNPLRALTAYRPWRDLDEYPGTAPEILTWADPDDLERMRGDIQALRGQVDLLLVNHHWGTSMAFEVRDFQREIAHASVEAGADLVLGGHPHVLQGVEFYKGRPIVHSMGNLIFDFRIPHFTEATRQTALFGCTLTRDGVRDPYLIPCRNEVGDSPALLFPGHGEGREVAQLMGRLCTPFGARLEAEGERVLLIPPEE